MEPANSEHAAGTADETETGQQGVAAAEAKEVRSNYGTVPGSELPTFVYVTVFAAFAWILLASWVAFAGDADADLPLSFVVVLALVFFGLPVLVYLTAKHRARKQAGQGDFLTAPVETWTETLAGGSAWLQILLIPAALALAATLIGAVNLLVH